MNITRVHLNQVLVAYETKASRTMATLGVGFVLLLPEKCRKRLLRMKNCLECLNEEIRRCEQVIRIFQK